MGVLWKLAGQYLRGRKLRTALTTLAVVFGVTVLFGTGSLVPAMAQSFRANSLATAGKVDLTVSHVSRGTFGPEIVDIVKNTNGIGYVAASLQQTVPLPDKLQPAPGTSSDIKSLTVVGADPLTAAAVRSYPISSGRFLVSGDALAVVVPEKVASSLGLQVGSRLVLPSADGSVTLEVVGLAATRPLPGVQQVFVPLTTAQSMLNQKGMFNTVEAMFASGADSARVEAQVRAALGEGYDLAPIEFGGELAAGIALGEKIFVLFGIMALAMGGFIIFNTFRTAVAERRRDLGMLRALGATRRTLLGLIVIESLIQGLIGSALGILAGYGMSVGLMAIVNPIARQFWRFDMGSPALSTGLFVQAIALGVGMTVLSGLIPAIGAMRASPMDALRPPAAAVESRGRRRSAIAGGVLMALAIAGLFSGRYGLVSLGALVFLVGLLLASPALVKPLSEVFGRLLVLVYAREGHIARGNLARQPGRAAVTASTVMIALAVVVSMAGLATTVKDGMVRLLNKSLGAAYMVMPASLVLSAGNVPAAPGLVQDLKAVPGIGDVTSLRLSNAVVDGALVQVIGVDPTTFPKVAGLVFSSGDSIGALESLSRERAVIVNGIYAAQKRISVGSTLAMETPNGLRDYRVVAVANDFLNAKISTGFVSQDNLAADFHQTGDVLVMADGAPGADKETVRLGIQAVVDRYPAFTLLDSTSFMDSVMPTVDKLFGLVYALLIALAVPSLIAMVNTLAISVIERTREIGTLRAIGGTRRQIGRLIQGESLILAALGTAFGIVIGLWFGYVLVGALNVSGFQMQYFFPYSGILLAVVGGLLIGIAASAVPARQAARMDIVQALHYE